MTNNKHALRQQLRHQRKILPLAQQQMASLRICKKIQHLTRYRLSKHIAFYLSFEGEIDPMPLLLDAHHQGKKCYLPVLHPQKINTLCFLTYAPDDPLITNRFGIPEPQFDTHKVIPAWQLDVVFVPLVGFDQHNNRLGMGKGYYDRTFEFMHSAHTGSKPYLIGLAYQMQCVEDLATEPHDVRLDTVITEKP